MSRKPKLALCGIQPHHIQWHIREAPSTALALALAQARFSFFERAAYKQQAVETHSVICQMKTQPASWTTAAANFFFLALRAPD
jgi:hypothetical protein